MRIAFVLSNYGGSPLQVGLERGLRELGHEVVYWWETLDQRQRFDLVVVLNHLAHMTGYVYPPELPRCDRLAFVDSAEYGYFKRLPEVAGRYWNAFSPGSMEHDTKNLGQQERLREWLTGRSFPYFLREYSKYLEYPAEYHPIDYPLYKLSEEPRRPDREEYLRRPLDLFVSWGASHPWRLNLTEELRALPIRSEIGVLEEPMPDGTRRPRMAQAEYFEKMRSARCTVSFDGYGSGSFRRTEALVRTVLVDGPLTMVERAPLVNGETCLTFGITSHGTDFYGSSVGMNVKSVVACPHRAYEIYERGYDFCMAHLTERATAQYLLDVCAAHDWSRPTRMEMAG